MDTVRIKKGNIEREVPEASKAGYIAEDWKEITISFASMKLADLKVLATEKGIEFDANIKKEELLKLLESAA